METELTRLALSLPPRTMPIPVGHPNVGLIGEVIPGRGFRLVGMSSRSYRALMRGEISARKAFSEMGAIIKSGSLFNKIANTPFVLEGFKNWTTTNTPYWYNSFRWTGMPGAAAAYTSGPPYNGRAYNSSSQGALPIPAASPNERFVWDLAVDFGQSTTYVMLVDILVIAGGIPGNGDVTTTINMPDLPRYTDGEGVMCFAEADVAGTYGGTTLFYVIYTNSKGTGSRNTESWMTHPWAHTITRIPVQTSYYEPFMFLAAGDTGCRKINYTYHYFGYQVTDSKTAVGNVKPLLIVPTLGQFYSERPPYGPLTGLVKIYDGACLSFFLRVNAASTRFNYHLKTVTA